MKKRPTAGWTDALMAVTVAVLFAGFYIFILETHVKAGATVPNLPKVAYSGWF